MHIPPNLIAPVKLPERASATSPSTPQAALADGKQATEVPATPHKANLNELLQQAQTKLPLVTPQQLALKLDIKQPSLFDALVTKQHQLPLQAEQFKQLAPSTRDAVNQWQQQQTAAQRSTALLLTTLLVAKVPPTTTQPTQLQTSADKRWANGHQITLITPQRGALGKVGDSLAIILGAKGELAALKSSANASVPSAQNATTSLIKQLVGNLSKTQSLATSTTIKSELTSVPTNINQSASATSLPSTPQRYSAIAHLYKLLAPGSSMQPTQNVTGISQRITQALNTALALPKTQQLAALPRPLMAATEQILSRINPSSATIGAFEQLLLQLTPKPQLQQLPAIIQALAILNKLAPHSGDTATKMVPNRTQEHASNTASNLDVIEALHRQLKQDLTQLSQGFTRSLLARSLGQWQEPLHLQQELAIHTGGAWLNGHIEVEEKPHKQAGSNTSQTAAGSAWQVQLALEVPMRAQNPLTLEVRVVWQGAHTQITFWSPQQKTCEHLNQQKHTLIKTLTEADIGVKECRVVEGEAPHRTQAITQQWTNIDIHT